VPVQTQPSGGADADVPVVTLHEALGAEGLRDLDDRIWRAEAIAGRQVFIDVWATWCAPCLADLPALRQLVRTRVPALVVLGVSLDTMPRRDFLSWLSRHDVGWPQHYDGRGYRGPVADRLGVTSLPASLLFARDGRLVARGLRAREVEEALGLRRSSSGSQTPSPVRAVSR
jgi:thiol-disulfide isomerase/thioredoxin